MSRLVNSNLSEGYGGPVRMDNYNFDGIDPTLDDCCRREVESNRVHNALSSTLSRHDITRMAERRRRHILSIPKSEDGCSCSYDPRLDGGDYPALAALRESLKREEEAAREEEEEEYQSEKHDENVNEDNENENEEEDSDDEFDYLLDEDLPVDNELEERRRAELEFKMLMQQTAQLHGYGIHRQMHPCRVLKAIGLSGAKDPPSAVVLHLVDPDSTKSASMDLLLEDLAKNYRGTKFLRSYGRSALLTNPELASSLPGIKVVEDMPCLVSILKGTVVAACPRLESLVDNDEHAVLHAVENWLNHTNVLHKGFQDFDEMCHIRPEEEIMLDDMRADQEREKEERYNCGVKSCNKFFPHEHIGICNEEQKGLVLSEETILGTSS